MISHSVQNNPLDGRTTRANLPLNARFGAPVVEVRAEWNAEFGRPCSRQIATSDVIIQMIGVQMQAVASLNEARR